MTDRRTLLRRLSWSDCIDTNNDLWTFCPDRSNLSLLGLPTHSARILHSEMCLRWQKCIEAQKYQVLNRSNNKHSMSSGTLLISLSRFFRLFLNTANSTMCCYPIDVLSVRGYFRSVVFSCICVWTMYYSNCTFVFQSGLFKVVYRFSKRKQQEKQIKKHRIVSSRYHPEISFSLFARFGRFASVMS